MLTNKQICDLSHEEWVVFKSKNRKKLLNVYPHFNFSARLDVMIKIKEILEKEKINLFLSNGTLLGAYREKDFIPWDNDVDMDVLAEEFEIKYDRVKEELISAGYIVRGIKRYPDTKINVYHMGEKVGILSLYLDKVQDIRYRGPYVWPNKMYTESEKIMFKGAEFNAPKLLDYMLHQYGEDWKIPNSTKNYLANSVFRKGARP